MFISKLIHAGADNAKLRKITINDKTFVTPCFFASITTASTRTPIGELLDTVYDHQYSKLLVSSYDIFHQFGDYRNNIVDFLSRYQSHGNLLFLDSGLFEVEQFKLDNWNFDRYKEIIRTTKSDLFASYDVMAKALDGTELISETLRLTASSHELMKNNQCITICHGNGTDELCNVIENVISNNTNHSKIIAVAERECGNDIREMYHTIKKIRSILDKYNSDSVLHILGCGDPLSIAILSYAGADSFDAVDWNRWLINNKTLQFDNLNNIPLLDCSCEACVTEKISNKEKAYRHNLSLYDGFLRKLQTAIFEDNSMLIFLNEQKVDQKTLTKLHNFFYS